MSALWREGRHRRGGRSVRRAFFSKQHATLDSRAHAIRTRAAANKFLEAGDIFTPGRVDAERAESERLREEASLMQLNLTLVLPVIGERYAVRYDRPASAQDQFSVALRLIFRLPTRLGRGGCSEHRSAYEIFRNRSLQI